MKIKIGDKVWHACCGTKQIKVECPICYGKLAVTLILGNGDKVELPCDYCGKGYGYPQGVVTEWEYIAEPEQREITNIRCEITGTGEKREYLSGHYILYPDIIFPTREDALGKCEEIKKKLEHEQETQAKHIKGNVNKTYSWNAGYHMRIVKKAKIDIEYHSKKAIICKSKAKEKNDD